MSLLASAHPRAGGENAEPDGLVDPDAGSSPRGRGKLCRALKRAPDGGLIPARAGKTTLVWEYFATEWAHPRAGGENALAVLERANQIGSSPRGRGKPDALDRRHRRRRLIPARAGKTIAVSASVAVAGAHPRAGGENPSSPMTPGAMPGSSPRGREKRSLIERLLQLRRLIPARAGKTKIAVSSPFNHEAHPRAGGENTWASWRFA